MTFADQVLTFYRSLRIETPLPKGIEVLNPYQDDVAFELTTKFYRKYYNDHNRRTMIMGINPGRFGAGLTGVPFTDPVKLQEICGIANDLPKKTELSADFIHTMIAAFGGCEKFFSKFYFNSVSPLGFTQNGRNVNYYDSPLLLETLADFIKSSIRTQLQFNIDTRKVFCLGEGQNFKHLNKLNAQASFFDQVVPLAHPRFIMQYRRKKVPVYIEDYLEKLRP
jgi:hypothetical protein